MLGPNDLEIGHLGQVCTPCTFSYQTLHSALDRCLDHFQSKKCKNVILWPRIWWCHKPPNMSSERAWLGDCNIENRSLLWQILLEFKEISLSPPEPYYCSSKIKPLKFFSSVFFEELWECSNIEYLVLLKIIWF